MSKTSVIQCSQTVSRIELYTFKGKDLGCSSFKRAFEQVYKEITNKRLLMLDVTVTVSARARSVDEDV